MKKRSVISSIVLFMVALTLSGCIFPGWGDGRGGHGGEGRHEDERR
jgi:hypothetical protein